MARTYEKGFKMDTITETPDFLALDELDFFEPYPVLGGINDDACVGDLKSQGQDGGEWTTLEDLDLHYQGGLLGTSWLAEKFDFNSFDPTLAGTTETLAELTKVEETPFASTFLEDNDFLKVIQDSCIPGTEMFPTPVEMPTTPEQKVPDYEALSPYSLSSTESFMSDESNPPSPTSSVGAVTETCVTVQNLLTTSVLMLPPVTSDNDAEVTTTEAMHKATPYTRKIPKPTAITPKVKTPSQRQRKRVQNKDAATRYRVKKRDEQSLLLDEAKKLEKENTELKDKVASLGKEIEYLKVLMLEVYSAKKKNNGAAVKKN